MVLRGLKPKKLQNIMAPNKLSMSAAKSKSLCRVKFMVTHRIGSTLLKLGHINNHRVRRFHTRKPNKGNATSNLLHYHCQIMFLTKLCNHIHSFGFLQSSNSSTGCLLSECTYQVYQKIWVEVLHDSILLCVEKSFKLCIW